MLLNHLVPELHVNIRKRRMNEDGAQNETRVYIWSSGIQWKIRDGELRLVLVQYSVVVQRNALYDSRVVRVRDTL